jgi:uncharacterized membrane protein YidH (DUF202 family)
VVRDAGRRRQRHGRRPQVPGVLLDAGLQPERTHLAWRRTALSVTVGGLVALRVLPPALGTWGLLAGALGVAAGLATAGATSARARRVAVALRAGDPLPGGGVLVGVTGVVTVGAVVGLLAVIALAGGR